MKKVPGSFMNIHQWVEQTAVRFPSKPAIWHNGETVDFKTLNAKANQLAAYLNQDKQVFGGRVGICLERSPELMIAILAVLKAGAAYVPFDAEYPADRLQYMAEVSDIPVMITTEQLKSKLPAGNYKTIDPGNASLLSGLSSSNPDHTLQPEQPAYVLFTSGSTGKPKGVILPHRALSNLIDWQLKNTVVHEDGRTLQFAPVSFDVHFQEIFSTWADGGCIYLINDELRLNALELLTYLEKNKINRLFLPFIALQNLSEIYQNSKADLSSLQEIITAGEQLQVTPALMKLFERNPHCTLYNHYGPTEAHVVSSYKLEGKPGTWPKLPSIGKAIQNTELYILDENGKPVKKGDEGELFIAGICLASGYLFRDDLTAERFIDNPFSKGEKMYRTGDLSKEDTDGNILYLGRIDGQVKVRGYRIELGEIEVVLARYNGVSQVAVTVREDKPGEKRLVAYLVKLDGSSLNVKDVRTHLQTQLPDYMMPSAFVQMDELPRTPSGKIDRRSLPAPDQKRPELGVAYAVPATTTEKLLAALWSRLLNIEPVGINDNFFDLGGNSLLALQGIALLKQEKGIDISVVKVYQLPTISALAKLIDGNDTYVSLKDQMRERAQSRHNKAANGVEDAIAVVGMSLNFPGAETPEQFWNNLKNGVESVTFFGDTIDPSVPDELRNDPNYVRARGIIKDAEGFDAPFFNMNPNVAKITDPQQRIFLELSWNALENAGYSPYRYKGLIGVFAGTGNNTYYYNNVLSNPSAVSRVGSFLAMTQNEKDYIATRVAYELNLKGLAVSVHTACSTSLTAITQACDALWNRQCDMALAGGVAITTPIRSGQRYEEGAMYSNDGHTRSFDSNAKGTVFSDGAGVVVLKRYKDAVADGDTIYALVRGAALNNDGGDKASFTAPSVEGQAAVISMAQAMAGIDARTISYVETHGTATPLGDPIEIEGLTKVFKEHSDDKQFCAIGSVKSNFGHLTAAAGVAGFIKTVLSLYHKQIPATLHYKEANPQIAFTESPFYVNAAFKNWDTDQLPRRAGVSSFGVGGTNAHIILEEAPLLPPVKSPERSKHLIELSAKTETALAARIDQLKNYLSADSNASLADIGYTLQTGRHHFAHRWFATVSSPEDAIAQLTQADPKRSAKSQLKQNATGIVFMFPGQGSQYVGMGSNLYRDELVFRDAVDRCTEILLPLLGRDLKELLFAAEGNQDAENLLKQTYYTQPALFTIGYSLAQLWMSWGIQPSALIGHSIGEFVAATISEVFTLEDALTVVATRSRMMQDLPGGDMLSVRLPAADVEKLLPSSVSIAAINGPQLCVVAGPHEEIEKLRIKWEQEEVMCKALFTSHAFHSPMMEPIVKPFAEAIGKIKLGTPKIPILSTVSTEWMTDTQATDPMYWANHLRATVKFAEGVKALWSHHPQHIMLELGPRNTASTLARQQSIDIKSQKAIPSLGDSAINDSEWTSLLSAIGQLWLSGIEIDWNTFYALEQRKHIALPGYPFEHVRFWLDPPQQNNSVVATNNISPEYHSSEIISSSSEDDQVSEIIMSNRKEVLVNELREILEESSGIEMAQADPSSSFIELGLDSLFLTQIALTLTKKYGTKITFRQLNEDLSSLANLSGYIDQQLPSETIDKPVAPVAKPQQTQHPVTAASPAMMAMPAMQQMPADGSMQWLIQQQMQLMQQQLMMMSGQVAAPISPVASFTPPTAPANIPSPAAQKDVVISAEEMTELKKPYGAIARIEKAVNGQFDEKQQKWLSAFTAAYTTKTKKSKSYTQTHRAHLADPRVVTGFRPHLKELIYQPVVNRSLGSRIWDVDGNEYVDVLNGFGSNMFGHNPDFIVKALEEQLSKGYELGPQHDLAGDVAKMICDMTGFDRAGLCNTGSEAVLGAMRIARTVTGRHTIISFNGSYHGINDEVILRGSKKLKSVPASAGIPAESVQNMLVLDYGTPEALEIIRSRAHEIAAVLVEPVQSRRADFRPKEFLQEVRKITEQAGALLIFDEVITGFRVLPGGAQQFYDIKADVGTYGKVVGGGMPIGVIAGRKDYMDALDGGFWQYGDASVPEVGVTYFAGTFVRHPFALAAAKASLLHMIEKGQALQEGLNALTEYLVKEVNDYCHKIHVPFHLVSIGSLFKPKYDADIPNADLIYLLLRFKGVHIYDGFPCFLTEAHSREDVDFIIQQFKDSLRELVENNFLPGNIPAVNGNGYAYSNGNGNGSSNGSHPPVPGAMMGKNPDGSPGWFLPDPERPGKFLKVNPN